jgi:hypothetical protein
MDRSTGIKIGGSVGFLLPLTLALSNEILFATKQVENGNPIWNAVQICAFERRWFPLYPKVIHAPGCENKTLGGLPAILLLSTTAGMTLGGVLGKRKINVEDKTAKLPASQQTTPATKPQTPVASSSAEPKPQAAAPSQSNLERRSLPSISPQITDGLQRVRGLEWTTIRKSAAIAGAVAVIGAGAISMLIRKDTSGLDNGIPSNIAKVLNRVKCHSSYSACSQRSINEIWNVCLENGFVGSMPSGNVKAARDINELVTKEVSTMNTRPKIVEQIDDLGVVTEVNQGSEEYVTSYKIQGYCIGSEYILE